MIPYSKSADFTGSSLDFAAADGILRGLIQGSRMKTYIATPATIEKKWLSAINNRS